MTEEIVQETAEQTTEKEKTTEKKHDYAVRFTKGATPEQKLDTLNKRIAALQKEKRRQKRVEQKAAAEKAEKARTHRKCVLAGTVEKVEGREIPLGENDRMDDFEEYYRNLKRQAVLGSLIEAAAGRKIKDVAEFEKWIITQNKWIKG